MSFLSMLAGCASAPKPVPQTAVTAAEVAAPSREDWQTHDEFEMSIASEKERQVHLCEQTALHPKLVTQQKARP